MVDVIIWSGVQKPIELNNMIHHVTRPNGVYQLAGWLRKHGISCQIIEFTQLMTADEIVELTRMFIGSNTFCLGVSKTFWQYIFPSNIFEAYRKIKSLYPNIKTVGGGPVYLGDIDKLFQHNFYNDSEESFTKWCLEQKNDMRPVGKFDITQLDHKFAYQDAILPTESLPIELGRGCIFKCTFCGFDKIGKAKGTYQRKFDLIVDEMKYNRDTFGITKYLFTDDTVNEDMEKIENLSKLKTLVSPDIKWFGFIRADLLWSWKGTPELLKESGLVSAFFGIESFHPKASANIGKGWAGKHGKEFLPELYHNIWNKEINLLTAMIAGLPYDTEENMYQDFEWLKNQKLGMAYWAALNLNMSSNDKTNASKGKSEFAKNPEKYGIKVFNIANPHGSSVNWAHDTYDYQKARELKTKFNTEIAFHNRVSGWAVSDLMNLGLNYTEREIMQLPWNDGVKLYEQHVDVFKNNYIKKLVEVYNNL